MMSFYDFFEVFTKVPIFITIVSNFLLIYLTIFQVKQIVGTYKYMIILYSVFGIGFSICDQIAKPFIHSYNGYKSLLYFSYGEGWFEASLFVRLGALVMYAGFYILIVAFAAVQFVYRYLALVNPDLTKWFQKFGVIFWILYPFLYGVVNSLSILFLTSPDGFTDDYLR